MVVVVLFSLNNSPIVIIDDIYMRMMYHHIYKNALKCPTCGSTNIERISAGKKLMGSMMFGLFSKDAKCTFHCKNCNYKW